MSASSKICIQLCLIFAFPTLQQFEVNYYELYLTETQKDFLGWAWNKYCQRSQCLSCVDCWPVQLPTTLEKKDNSIIYQMWADLPNSYSWEECLGRLWVAPCFFKCILYTIVSASEKIKLTLVIKNKQEARVNQCALHLFFSLNRKNRQ